MSSVSLATGSGGPSKISVTLTEFMDFVTASGTPKLTAAKNAKQNHQRGYDPRRDFYKLFRDKVQKMHLLGRPAEDLAGILVGLHKDKKSAYTELVAGFTKFVKGRTLSWSPPPKAQWTSGDLTVTINPELAITLDGVPFVIKMYLKDAKLTSYNIAVVNHLMALVLKPQIDPATLGVLNVRKAKLHPAQPALPGLTTLLHGEAATFIEVYRELEKDR